MKEGSGFIKIGRCVIDASAEIKPGAILGKPFRRFLDGSQEKPVMTTIGANVYVGYYTIIGSGSTIGDHTIIDDRSTIESRVTVGKNTLIIYGAQLCNDVIIGDGCVIGGIVGERTKVGNCCRVFGEIIHSQQDPSLRWDDEHSTEPSGTIHDFAFIGFGAIVSGGITIGRKAYVSAGAIVTKNVPDLHIASGINQIVHFSQWKGPLKKSRFFQT